jgi:hypothetical protein
MQMQAIPERYNRIYVPFIRCIGEQPFRLLHLPPAVLLIIADYIDLWDFARLEHTLRNEMIWLEEVFLCISFEFHDKSNYPPYVLSWCFKREVKITSFAIRNDWGFWMEFSHYLTKGGDESIIELQFLNHPSVDFLDLVTTLEKSELILSSLKKLRFDFWGVIGQRGVLFPSGIWKLYLLLTLLLT